MPQDNNKTITRQMANAVLLPEVVRMVNEGHTVTLPLKGYSMRPFLEDGRDKAILKAVTELKNGDAVLAEIEPRHYVLHRIIGIDGDRVTLRGDGNFAVERCRLDNVKAIAIGFYRKNRQEPDYTDGRKWRIYSWLWMRLYPIRRYLLFIHRHLFVRKQH